MDASPLYVSFIAGAPRSAAEMPIVYRENPGHPERIAARWRPATGADANAAMEAAAEAARPWARWPLTERVDLLVRLLAAVEARAADFATLITDENGKTWREARAEVAASLADARHVLHEATRRGLVERFSPIGAPTSSEVILEPVGPCLLVTPWNFPLATILRKLVPALAYGNSVVVKPSELTPGPASLLFSLLAEFPFPPGTASLVLGEGPEIGALLVGHPALRAISFTGSNGVGSSIARLTTGRDVRLQLEMGGKNSLIVLADADLDAAVEAALVGGFSCAGQWCTGTGRVIVEQALHDKFTDRLSARAASLRVGPGDEDTSELGPLASAARVGFAQSAVAAAVEAGARVRCGGHAVPGGHFYAATILDRVTETMPVFLEELFVPVVPIAAARDPTDAIRMANTGVYGLSASVFSRDVEAASVLAQSLEAGLIHFNLHTAYRESALPVGGWRESGRGLPECGRFGRDFFTRPRAVYSRRP